LGADLGFRQAFLALQTAPIETHLGHDHPLAFLVPDANVDVVREQVDSREVVVGLVEADGDELVVILATNLDQGPAVEVVVAEVGELVLSGLGVRLGGELRPVLRVSSR